MTRITMMMRSLNQSQILEYVKSSGLQEASLQTKLVEVIEFELRYLKFQKMMLLMCCKYVNKFRKLSNDHKTGKGWFSFQSQRKGNAKECSKYCMIVFISHVSKVILKILQTRLQPQVNRKLPDVQAGFRKGRETRDQIASICCIMEKAREFQEKTSNSSLLTTRKPLTLWVTTNWKILKKRWEYQTTLTVS